MTRRRLLSGAIAALAGATLLACCILVTFGDAGSVAVADVSRPTDFTVSTWGWEPAPLGRPSGVTIRVTGEITGEAEVWGDYWERKRLSGRVDWRVHHDWFPETLHLNYKPLGAVSGHLVIHYEFH